MQPEKLTQLRKLSQHYAYASIQMHEAVARKAGLSGTDHKYLGFLIQKGEMTAGELSQLTGLSTGAVTGLLDRLEDKKLVRRRLDKADRRKVLIEPVSANIMALLEPLYKSFRTESEVLMASFSEAEARIIERYFQKAIAIMEASTRRLNNPE